MPSSFSQGTEPFCTYLVHNVSHHDLLLALRNTPNTPDDGALDSALISRPRFHQYLAVSEAILEHINKHGVMTCMQYDVRCKPRGDTPENSSDPDTVTLPFGQKFEPSLKLPSTAWDGLGVRSKAKSLDEVKEMQRNGEESISFVSSSTVPGEVGILPSESVNAGPDVLAVFFPIMASILPQWLRISEFRQRQQRLAVAERCIYLICGSGTPANRALPPSTNSTRAVALLLSKFIETHYGSETSVKIVESGDEIFKFDANLTFVKRSLCPLLEEKRRQLAATCGENWHRHLHLTLSLTYEKNGFLWGRLSSRFFSLAVMAPQLVFKH